ncbi:twin-arginine translocation signal domain-containing protein, partial [Hyella patelloides]|uniref:twin-arginine translocation signal domain-containing protein n=1 Tax=Hyella patelloides TaxID=1982969 RepID=UPI0011A2FDE4
MVKFNRRQFIVLGTAGTGAAIVGSWLHQETMSSQPLPLSSANAASVYQSSDGLLELDLEASERPVNLGDRQAYLLTYNGQ